MLKSPDDKETLWNFVCECGVPARIREIPYDLNGQLCAIGRRARGATGRCTRCWTKESYWSSW